MPSNLNIKYGDKNSIPNPSAGNILAAKNSAGEIEMYIDTPINNTGETTERKRLDPRIYVGDLSNVPTPTGLGTNPTSAQIEQAKTSAIWDNYDVWIDTSGDPTGDATPGVTAATSTTGLMSADTIFGLSQILTQLQGLKLQIVSQSYWNTNSNPYGSNGGNNLANRLTIVLPDSAVPSGQTASNYRPVDIDFSGINIVPTGGSGS